MNFLEVVAKLTSLFEALSKLQVALRGSARLVPSFGPDVSYENLLLDIGLDIHDARGKTAVVVKRQQVRFLTEDGGVIRDRAWGDGDMFARYTVRGARRIVIKQEGSKCTAFLVLTRRFYKGEKATVRTVRRIEGGFRQASEYFEAQVERPTRKLLVEVMFPAARPPREASIVDEASKTEPAKLTIRQTPNGRPLVRWVKKRPKPWRTYSLRWSW